MTEALAKIPVKTLREAAPHLRRPFSAAAVKWKVQTQWNGGAIIVAYIDARLVSERLNAVCPDLWTEHYEPYGDATRCYLTIDGRTHEDVGTPQGSDSEKSAFSDALKRAAVKFGVGVSVYAMATVKLNVGPNLSQRDKNGKLQTNLTDAGKKWLQEQYERWLEAEGRGKNFGEVLDHGDQDGAQGVEIIESAPEVAADLTEDDGGDYEGALPEAVEAVLKEAEAAGLFALVNRNVAALATVGKSHAEVEAFCAATRADIAHVKDKT